MTPEQHAKQLAAKRRYNERHRERLNAEQAERRRKRRVENPLPTLEQRFFAKVDKNGPTERAELGPCWLWTGQKDDWGYGVFCCGSKKYKAHRYAWLLSNGAFPENLACHQCDNPACVRADHLFEGDNAANAADMVAKGRQSRGPTRGDWSRGEKHKLAKLSDEKVRAMCAKYAAKEATQYQLAQEYRVSQSLVNRILQRKIWRHVQCAS